MKFKLAAAVLCAAGISAPAVAGDVEDVKALVAKAQAAYNSCDVDTMKGLTHAEFFGFNLNGTLTTGNDMAEMKAACDAGTKYNFNLTIAKVHTGDGWAVVAGNNKGKVTPAEGEAQEASTHFTVVLVKDGNNWKSLHLHSSPDIQAAE